MSDNNYTSLVGVKWTKRSLLKCLREMYQKTIEEIQTNTKMSDKEKHKRTQDSLIMFHSIYDPIKKYGVTVKKNDDI